MNRKLHEGLTTSETYRQRNYWLLAPAIGSVAFVVLYVAATQLYAGGSQADKAARGFDWVHNYWCNLLNERAVNGEVNGSRPVALVAAAVLSVTMGWFSWIFPSYAGFSRGTRWLVRLSGIGSMVLAIFIFAELHDMLINLAGLLGLVMMVGTLTGLWKLRWIILFWIGVLNLVLVALNNVLYYNKSWLVGLPLVQKITFLMFLVWVSWISVRVFYWNSKRG